MSADGFHGTSLVVGAFTPPAGAPFHAWDPAANVALPASFHTATRADLAAAVAAAREAFPSYAALDPATRVAFLRAIATSLESRRDALVARAQRETALPAARLHSELGRTVGQLQMFAALLAQGDWVDARIDRADPSRTPQPKPDVRSMLRPLGPVAVFGASNFPFAYSVAGGDTAAALAAGCPVIAKAHPAHPGVSELTALAVRDALTACNLAQGIFALLHDAGHALGGALVQHPGIAAVAFTGSQRGGRALMDLAAARPVPIPVFAEMGSTNPVFLLPGALRENAAGLAAGLASSVTVGVGQFCTNPGVLVALRDEATAACLTDLATRLAAVEPAAMLTPDIARAYARGLVERAALTGDPAPALADCGAPSALFRTSAAAFLETPALREELFGPTTLAVLCESPAEMRAVAHDLDGQLTATVHAAAGDATEARALAAVLETRAGRVVFNGFPTGVEVCDAMVHGGPYPATSDGRTTSVGTRAIARFTRAVAWQGAPDDVLPPALKNSNPLHLRRLVDGVSGDAPIEPDAGLP